MKTFRMIGMALVAMVLSFSLSSCQKDAINFIEVDYSKDLTGTWTCLQPDVAEALVISADGSVISSGIKDGEYWENVKGTYEHKNNKIDFKFEDGDYFNGRFEIIPGETLSLVNTKTGERLTYRYCEHDYSKDILGMWIAQTDKYTVITHINENNKFVYTGSTNGTFNDTHIEPSLSQTTSYKLMGDIFSYKMIVNGEETLFFNRLRYAKDGSVYGDVLRLEGAKGVESVFLRVKQDLELPSQKYDYTRTYLTNASGLDRDFNAGGIIINFAKLDGHLFDKIMKTMLFAVEFPDANTIKCSYTYNGETILALTPIEVDGNKMTVKMSETSGHLRNVDLYTFQDKENTQMHIYMSRSAFINFFGNISVSLLVRKGELDPSNKAAVDAVYDQLTELIKTLNVSLVMSKSR